MHEVLSVLFVSTLTSFSVLLGSGSAVSEVPQASATCLLEAPIHRSTADWFITHPSLAPARDEAGITGADPAQLRLLTDAADSAACHQLNTVSAPGGVLGTPPSSWVYYQLGNRYVVVSAATPLTQPGRLSTQMRFLAVFDAQFNFVTGFGF